MPTAMVVATIVNSTMSEAGLRQHLGEALRVNDRRLLDKLADADGDANVVTAVLNVDEFLTYLIRRFPKTVDAAFATDLAIDLATDLATDTVTDLLTEQPRVEGFEVAPQSPAEGAELKATELKASELKALSEGEFMDYMLQQIESGAVEPLVRFSEKEWDDGWDDDGDVGEDMGRYPFFY